MSTAISLLLLVAVLGFAVVRPAGLPEAVGAVPAAVLTVLAGLVPWRDAVHELADLGPTPGLVLAVLLGANIGPNLTYVGSLATLCGGRSCTKVVTRP